MHAENPSPSFTTGGRPRLSAFRSLLGVFVATVPVYAAGIALLEHLLAPRGIALGFGVLAIWLAAIVVWIVSGLVVKHAFRFSLRALLVTTAVVAILCFMPVYFVRPYLGQLRAIAILEKAGVGYQTTSDAPAWLQRLVGPKNCRIVTSVQGFQQSNLDDSLLENLSGSAHIRELFIGNSLITDKGLDHIQGMSNVVVLDLPGNSRVSNACFVHLPAMKQLKWIDASDVPVKDEGLAFLSTLTQLDQIELNRSKITDNGLEHLGALTGLRRLILDKNPITNSGLKELDPLTNLEILSLNKTEITDDGLVSFGKFKKLRVLRLSGTKITDAGLQHLAGLKSLAVLDLEDTQVTINGMTALHGALPECEIIHGAWPKGNRRGPEWASMQSGGYSMYSEARLPY
jgi:hypothetical protein